MTEIFFRVRRGLHVDLRTIDKSTAKVLRELFDYANPEFSKKERLGLFTGSTPRRVQSYEEVGHELVLPRGGTQKVRDALKAYQVSCWFEDERLDLPPDDRIAIRDGAEPIDMRPHQQLIVETVLERENCLIRSATGSGKTEAILDFILRAKQPALIVVWTAGLLTQWVDRIKLRWGWKEKDIGLWGGGKKRLGLVTIGMQQTLVRDGGSLADKFGIVVADEVQKFAASTFREVIAKFPARYRVGVSADERRKDKKEFLIRDSFGDVQLKVDAKELVDLGHLCEVEVVVVPTGLRIKEIEDAPEESRKQVIVAMQADLQEIVATDIGRNRIAQKVAGIEARQGKSVLVFCNRTEQARELARSIAIGEAVPCGLMLGGAENKEAFRDAKGRLTSGELRCAVGSSAIYQGEDIPRLSVGIIVTPTAGNQQLLNQQVGRLRRKFPGKIRGRLYYLWDERIYPEHITNLKRWYGKNMVRVVEPGDLE